MIYLQMLGSLVDGSTCDIQEDLLWTCGSEELPEKLHRDCCGPLAQTHLITQPARKKGVHITESYNNYNNNNTEYLEYQTSTNFYFLLHQLKRN